MLAFIGELLGKFLGIMITWGATYLVVNGWVFIHNAWNEKQISQKTVAKITTILIILFWGFIFYSNYELDKYIEEHYRVEKPVSNKD